MCIQPANGKYSEDIYVSAHIDECLLCFKSREVIDKFAADLLSRFIGTYRVD